MGQPKKLFTDEALVIEKLSAMFLTIKDIALIAGVDESTISKNHRDAIERGRANGRKAIRFALYKNATQMNSVRAQIYLDERFNPQPKVDAKETADRLKQLGNELYNMGKATLTEEGELVIRANDGKWDS